MVVGDRAEAEQVLGEPGVDYPENKAVVDVVATSRSDVLMSWVEEVRDDELIITAPRDRSQRRASLENGERLELVWKGPDELRALPAELVGVDDAAEPRWHVRSTGPAVRGQRRAAVRAPMVLAVQIVRGSERLEGRTVDLSEGGVRCIFDGPAERQVGAGQVGAGKTAGEPPTADAEAQESETPQRLQVGDVVQVLTGWDGEEVSSRGEVVRRYPRQDGREEVSIRFIGLPQYVEDSIRRRVFTTLRELRLRGLM
jgi:PilZ domain